MNDSNDLSFAIQVNNPRFVLANNPYIARRRRWSKVSENQSR